MKSMLIRAVFPRINRLRPVSCRCALPTLLAASLALAACQPYQPGDREAYTTERILVQRANDMLQQAARENPSRRQALLLDAAEILIRAQQPARALQALQEVDPTLLSLPPLARYNLMQAGLALAEDNFFSARDYLRHPTLERMWRDLPVDLQRRWRRHRAALFALLGQEQRSVEEYVALTATLEDGEAITAIHQQLWQLLTQMPQHTLAGLLDSEQQRVLRGWYRLADISRSNQGDIKSLLAAIETWQQQWSWHPGALYPPQGLNDIRRVASQLPQQLALLLPLGGGYSKAGNAIQNGFMAAYYRVLEKGGAPPAIRVYDSSADPDIQTLYNRAVREGAEMVIGPLRKQNVSLLNRMGELPVPTVSLTYLQDPLAAVAGNLLQFGLSATNEARQAADRAWLEGHRRALAIVPESALGARTLAAFKEQWEGQGGELVSTLNYREKQVDFKAAVKSALLINHSEQRARRLADVLGQRLKSSPAHRRQDLDVVFMLSVPPAEGRQVKPMLDFFHADDLPVYATSLIFSGREDPGRDRDLDDIKFCAMPWILPGAIREEVTPENDRVANFFALGLDAYKIHQGALQMQVLPGTQLFGSTGALRMEYNRIVRRQPWAEFRGGKVRRAGLPKGER